MEIIINNNNGSFISNYGGYLAMFITGLVILILVRQIIYSD